MSDVYQSIRCTFLWYERWYGFKKAILYQPETGVTVMANVPTGPSWYPSYNSQRRHHHRQSNMQRDSESSTPKPHPLSNYGYAKADDALTWFYRNTLPLDEESQKLLTQGRHDNETRVEVSVTIKYTTEFAATLGIRMDWAMYMVSAWTIYVNPISVFQNQ